MSDEDATLPNRLRETREARGLSQVLLAERAQLTRQSISAIEAGRATPSVSVALRLARALGTTVESLFDDAPSESLVPVETDASRPLPPSSRLVLAELGGRWVAHALGPEFRVSADGLLTRPSASMPPTAEFLGAPTDARSNILVMGCAPALGVLTERLNATSGPGRFVWLPCSSTTALDALSKARTHLGGVHLVDPRSGTENVKDVRRHVQKEAVSLVTLGRWEVGLLSNPNMPRRVRSASDLSRRDLRIAVREVGSGARRLLDRVLREVGVTQESVERRAVHASGHLEVAQAVALGAADTGIATRDAARAFGLELLPLGEERYDLVLPTELESQPSVARLLDGLTSSAFRRELDSLGYDSSNSGERVARLSAA